MKYCTHCGNEIAEGAKFCRSCGSPAEVVQPQIQSVAAQPNTQSVAAQPQTQSVVAKTSTATKGSAAVKKSRKKIKKIWIVLGAVVLFLGIVAAVLFAPRNLEMDDFKKTNVVTAIIKYGLPDSWDSNEDGVYLVYDGTCYGDKIDFYGITPNRVRVYPEENKVSIWFDDDDQYDVYGKIKYHCKFKENIADLFHDFSYGNMKITTFANNGTYVSIKMY